MSARARRAARHRRLSSFVRISRYSAAPDKNRDTKLKQPRLWENLGNEKKRGQGGAELEIKETAKIKEDKKIKIIEGFIALIGQCA